MDITKKKVIFIDMDGTLIDTVSGNTFPEGVWDMKLKMEVFAQLWGTFIPLCSNRNSSMSLRVFNRTSV